MPRAGKQQAPLWRSTAVPNDGIAAPASTSGRSPLRVSSALPSIKDMGGDAAVNEGSSPTSSSTGQLGGC